MKKLVSFILLVNFGVDIFQRIDDFAVDGHFKMNVHVVAGLGKHSAGNADGRA